MIDIVELIHRVVAYPTGFVIAPLAFIAFLTPRVHRRWGRIYVGLMIFLYVTGTAMTVTRHPWGSWDLARNLAFNLLGFSTAMYGWRAGVLFGRAGAHARFAAFDRALLALLTTNVLALVAVAAIRDGFTKVFAVAAVALLVVDWREHLAPSLTRQHLYLRHARYMLVSYLYLLTVASIVHLAPLAPNAIKWLWPTALGTILVPLATSSGRKRPLQLSVTIVLTCAALFVTLIPIALLR